MQFKFTFKHMEALDSIEEYARHRIEKIEKYSLKKDVQLHFIFEAKKGDRIALIGKNGAGKTTLCRCLTGIYKPQFGQIKVEGKVRSIIDPATIIYPDLTGRENAKIMMDLLYPSDKGKAQELLSDALEFSGLGAHLDKSFRQYSNGMQTRLCLSLATCTPSDIFILDEVFEGADAEFQEKISARILRLISQSGIVFFVSHSESQIRRVCNKGLLLNEGKIINYGNLDQVFETYSKLNSISQ